MTESESTSAREVELKLEWNISLVQFITF